MFQMTGVFAEFERSMIRERVLAGLARARAGGKKLGRPALTIDIAAIQQDRKRGKPLRQIALEHGVSVGKIHAVISVG